MTAARVPFASLIPGEDAVAVRAAIDRVLASGWFVLGPEVEAFETELAAACGAAHAVGVGNGTDALALILKASGIGAGDEVITTPLSAAFTALAIAMVGASPVFVDIDPVRLTLDPEAVSRAVTIRTRAVMPVHLYGQPADMTGIERVAARHNLAVVEDCCQAHLATADGRPVGTIGIAGALSFYPTKNLGGLGDGGAVVTQDATLAQRIRQLRNGGQTSRYVHERPGINSRLDELQAAVLRARLPFLRTWTARRRDLAGLYRNAFGSIPEGTAVPLTDVEPGHVHHLYVVRTRRRAALQKHLSDRGVETLVHYPIPIGDQPAFADSRRTPYPVATTACAEILSLPLYPTLSDSDVRHVAAAVADF